MKIHFFQYVVTKLFGLRHSQIYEQKVFFDITNSREKQSTDKATIHGWPAGSSDYKTYLEKQRSVL